MKKNLLLMLLLACFHVIYGQSKDSLFSSAFIKDTMLSYAPDSLLFYYWNADTYSWEHSWKEEFKYVNSQLKKEQYHFVWSTNHWEPMHQFNYHYINGRLSETEYSEWDDYELDWFLRTRYTYTYDSLGNISKRLDSKWNLSESVWVNDSLMSYHYYPTGEMESSYISIWSSAWQEWENYSETLFNYSNGLKNRQVFSLWDFGYLFWDARQITNFEYDSNQMMSSQIQMVINNIHTQWLNNWKKEYQWSLNKQLQKETEWIWNEIDSVWTETYQTTHLYDNLNQLTSTTIAYFDAYYQEWMNLSRVEYRYRSNKKLIESTLYSWNYSQWNPVYRYNYYYPDYTQMTEDFAHHLQVYPNPANDRLTVHYSGSYANVIDVDLFDISGKRVFHNQFQYSNSHIEMVEFPIADLPNGLYILKASFCGSMKLSKVVIQHN